MKEYVLSTIVMKDYSTKEIEEKVNNIFESYLEAVGSASIMFKEMLNVLAEKDNSEILEIINNEDIHDPVTKDITGSVWSVTYKQYSDSKKIPKSCIIVTYELRLITFCSWGVKWQIR